MSALTEQDINEIEKVVGLPLPADVRAQYRASNGLKGPTDCSLLYAYGVDDADIVSVNKLREEEWFPAAFRSTIIVGDDGCGNLVGYDWDKKQAVLWNPGDGESVQERRETVTEIWAEIKRLYESAA
jgi:hypothetical protein